MEVLSLSYQLTLNEKKARVLSNALDLYARVISFQLETVADVIMFDNNDLKVYSTDGEEIPYEDLHNFKDALRQLKAQFLKCHPNSSHGIQSRHISDSARIAYDIHQVVRNSVYENSDGRKNRHSVYSHKPRKTSEEEDLPTISFTSP